MAISESWNTRIVPRSDHARLVAAETLKKMEQWGDIEAERLNIEVGPFFEVDWCIDALVKALHTRPNGSAQPNITVGRRSDLVRYLLNQWRDDEGIPLAPPVEPDSGTAAVSSQVGESEYGLRAKADKEWPRTVIPETIEQSRAALRALRGVMRWKETKIGDTELGELVSPFFSAGWSVECLVHALTTSGRTGQSAPFEPDPSRPISELIERRLTTWKNKRGLPKQPPKSTLSYDAWYAKNAARGESGQRERRKSTTRVQLEAVQQRREADDRRRRARSQDRVAQARSQDAKWTASMDALYEIGPPAHKPTPEQPMPPVSGRHERLIEGVAYLEATDTSLIRWLRSLIDMDPDEIGPEAGQVTRTRMRNARIQASLAALEHGCPSGRELVGVTHTLTEYVAGGPDLDAGQEVRELWQVLRESIRAHDRQRS